MCGKMDRYYLPTYTLPLWGISWIRRHWCHSGATFAFAWITPLPSLSLLKRLLISVNVWTAFCKWMCRLPSGSQSMVPGAVWTSFSPVQSQTFDSGIVLLSWPSALKNAISPSLSFSYCLFLTMMAVPFLKTVLVSFPCPPTHNLIYACVCLHIISFQWDCLCLSGQLTLFVFQNRSICTLLSSLTVPCLLPPSWIVRDTTIILFITQAHNMVFFALLFYAFTFRLCQRVLRFFLHKSPRCTSFPLYCWIM